MKRDRPTTPAVYFESSNKSMSMEDDPCPNSSDERHTIDNCRDKVPTTPDVIHSDELESSSSMLLEVEEIEDELGGFFWPENRE